MPLKESIDKAKRTLDIWHRVCNELDEGKKWEDIDNGLTEKMKLEHWDAYMRQTMYHELNDIVLSYEDETIDSYDYRLDQR